MVLGEPDEVHNPDLQTLEVVGPAIEASGPWIWTGLKSDSSKGCASSWAAVSPGAAAIIPATRATRQEVRFINGLLCFWGLLPCALADVNTSLKCIGLTPRPMQKDPIPQRLVRWRHSAAECFAGTARSPSCCSWLAA